METDVNRTLILAIYCFITVEKIYLWKIIVVVFFFFFIFFLNSTLIYSFMLTVRW